MHSLIVKILKPTPSTPANVLLVTLAGFILLIACILFFLPNIIRASANNWLADKGFESSIEVVEVSILDSRFETGGISATNSEGRGFNIGKAYLDFSWTSLWDKQVLITGIELADISLALHKNNDVLHISGIQLTDASQKDQSPDAVPPQDETQKNELPWKISLEKLKLSNIDVCYQQTTDASNNDGDVRDIVHDVCFKLGGFNWQGEVHYTLTSEQELYPFNINGEVALQEIKLTNNHFDKNVLSFDHVLLGELTLKLHDEPSPDLPTLLPMRIDSFELSGIDSCFQQSKSGKGENPLDGYCFILDKLNWAGAVGFRPASSPADKPLLHVDGTLALQAITLANKHMKRNALSIGEFRLEDIYIGSLDDINLGEFSISDLTALQKDGENKQGIVGFEKLSVKPVTVKNQNSASIDKVLLEGLQISYEKMKNGEMEHVQWLPQVSTKTEQSTINSSDKTGADKTEDFSYSVNSIDINNSKTISFTDHSLAETFDATVSDIKMTLQQLDSNKPLQMTGLDLKAKIYDFGSIEASGDISPLTPDITFDVKGKIRGLDLRKFNPYVVSAIDHIIGSGQLDSDFVLKSVVGQLDSNVDLTLHQFKLESQSDEATKNLDDIFGLPLNPSLALIRERDGSININADIKGDAENPDFNPVEIVTKAISTSIAKAVVVLYTPYGLIIGADALFDLATALRFDPVIFDAGSAELNVANAGEVTKLSKLLTERPQVHIQLCGSTSDADVQGLPGIKSAKEKPVKLSDEQRDKLVELSRKRAIATKQYLIEKANIAADRVILCTQKRQTAGESIVSGVEVTI